MSVIEASSGTYRSRVDGTIVLSVEIEPRNAAAALALFGMPGTTMALAALKDGYVAAKDVHIEDTPEKPKGGALSQLAGMWCNENEFYYFIRPVYDVFMGGNGNGYGDVTPNDDFDGVLSKYCAHCIKVICEINSRAQLDHDPVAAEKFHKLIRGPYQKHLIARGIVT